VVGDGALVDDLAVLVEHAEGMLLVAEIKSDGDEWNFGGHGSVELITAIKCRRSLPSHLILFALCVSTSDRMDAQFLFLRADHM